MLERYLYFKNILKYEIWWTKKNRVNIDLNYNTIFYFWKNKYIYFFSVLYNLFKNLFITLFLLVKIKKNILIFHEPFFKNKEFLIFNYKIFIFSYWLRGLLTNLEVLRWVFLYQTGHLLLKKNIPSLVFLLGKNSVLFNESKKLKIPLISFYKNSVYTLPPGLTKNLVYFYFSFFFSVINLIKSY
jgi:hypothetical protein